MEPVYLGEGVKRLRNVAVERAEAGEGETPTMAPDDYRKT